VLGGEGKCGRGESNGGVEGREGEEQEGREGEQMGMERKAVRAHTHTYPFNGPLSRTTRVSRYQKGKTNLDFTEA